jgi:hypothetical protein
MAIPALTADVPAELMVSKPRGWQQPRGFLCLGSAAESSGANMTSMTLSAETRAARAAAREERARDAALAMQQYEADKLAVLDKTARLRALRLAKETADALQPPSKQPKPKKPTRTAR